LAGASLAPFALMSVYLFFTRWPSYRFSALTDYVALGGSVLAGAALVALLPLRISLRALLLLVYLPLISRLLFYYVFAFIGFVFHDGL
jgi:hypothetical protein